MLRRKYIGSKALSQVVWKPGDSYFWAGLMALKEIFFRHGTFSINNGTHIWFWKDIWLGNAPLCVQYPALYNIVRRKSDAIATVMATSPPNVTFRRVLFGQRLLAWNSLIDRLGDIQLWPEPDEFRWNLHVDGTFSVHSLYKAILYSAIPVDNNKKIWKMKIPLKIKIFGWYLRRGVILIKDNLVKRNWHGSTRCVFCQHDETIKHLFFQCRFARSIWSIIQVASSHYPPTSVTNIFGNWLHGIDSRFKLLLRAGELAIM
jgi:hypothetical protein